MSDTPTASKTYTVPYRCDNCLQDVTQQFEWGTEAPQVAQCPNCGCLTARKAVGRPSPLQLQALKAHNLWNEEAESARTIG